MTESTEKARGALKQASEIADKNMDARACHFSPEGETRRALGYRYTSATRVKNTKLIESNADEDGWPGGRTHFDIDRDQILFNPNFVRLAGKTQVFTGPGRTVYRNRLIHTLDVVQLSRSIAHKNGLNVDLTEAIAYGHDIGHTPFGHTGEAALNLCLYELFIRLCINLPGGPEIGGLTGGKEKAKKRKAQHKHKDAAIWHLVQWLAMKDPRRHETELPMESDVQRLLGQPLFDELGCKNILLVDNGKCAFHEPLEWEGLPPYPNDLETEFWVQKGMGELFAHYVHGLRILLCNPKKQNADVTRQTAYGILSHSWRGAYESFMLKAPNVYRGGSMTLRKKDETREAFVVRTADNICFVNSDLNDAFEAGILNWDAWEKGGEKEKDHRRAIFKLANAPTSQRNLPSDSRRLQFCETGFHFEEHKSEYTRTGIIDKVRMDIIEQYVHPALAARQVAATRIIRELFWFYVGRGNNSRSIERKAQKRYDNYNRERWGDDSKLTSQRLAADYVAWLTDDEAIATHTALFAPQHASWERYFLDVQDV